MEVAIIGGGVAGLSLAMNLHARGIRACVFERAPEIRELGVGITLLPHAMREFAALGVKDELVGAGVVIRESCFFNRFGQLIYREDRGQHAGYAYPEVSIHRGRLHMILYRAALARLGAGSIRTDHECVRVEQDETGATAYFRASSNGRALEPVRADVIVACDGVNSALRRQFYPDDEVAFAGINTWRGITRRKPFLTGSSLHPHRLDPAPVRSWSIRSSTTSTATATSSSTGWRKSSATRSRRTTGISPATSRISMPIYQDWQFDWLDVAELIRTADQILEYPMVDKDPVARWTFGRVTLAGDAAHPMYPRGSNGAAQGAIDARTLADCLAAAMRRRRCARRLARLRGPAPRGRQQVVLTNRAHPPDFINIKVEELVGDRPFDNLDTLHHPG